LGLTRDKFTKPLQRGQVPCWVWSALREQATLELSASVSRGGNNTENNIDPEAVTPGGMQRR
jgi:hypothetical protein